MTEANSSALRGLLFAAPFVLMNFVVSLEIEPLFSILEMFSYVRNSSFLPLLLLLPFPVGAYVALRPVLRAAEDGKRKAHVPNILVASLLTGVFILLARGLAVDMYHCEILRMPNCD